MAELFDRKNTLKLKTAIKSVLFPAGKKRVRIKAGLLRGFELFLDVRSNQQLIFGLYERETQPFINSMLDRAKWFIDVGAGLGELCFLFAHHGIPAIGVEPYPDQWRTAENARLNGLEFGRLLKLETRLIGRGSSDEFVELDVLAQEWPEGPGFIKIDVDGAEIDVLRSAEEILRRKRAIFLVETHSAALERECIALFEAAEYRTAIIDNAWWRIALPEQRPHDVNRWLSAKPW